MSTYERSRPVSDARIPDGYEVSFHEIRGYDSPDRWFVCTGPHGWRREIGERRDAVQACIDHAEKMKPIRPDESGVLPCYLCRGATDRSVRGRECPVCGGTNSISVVQMAETHDGMVRLAEIAGRMLKDDVLPRWMKMLDPGKRSGVETLARNPCKRCGTWLLEPEWVGSAYCSRRCCVEDYKDDPSYASSILKGYDDPVRRPRGATEPIDDPLA
jgi:hypothetical protein